MVSGRDGEEAKKQTVVIFAVTRELLLWKERVKEKWRLANIALVSGV